jgi:hypothetical protein
LKTLQSHQKRRRPASALKHHGLGSKFRSYNRFLNHFILQRGAETPKNCATSDL